MYSMVKTKEIYYEDAYCADFDAIVISCEKGRKDGYNIVLDKTAFFPEQGGQSSDVGYISCGDERAYVTHASIKDGIITHVTDKEIAVGSSVHGEVDFAHRFSNMQQHTGEHIFSGIVSSRFGYDNVGFHLSDNEVTMDYSGPISEDDIRDVELAVNRAIWENLEVVCSFPSQKELENIDYRSKKELTGDIRIVTIPGYDVCACCAPHVKRTGEIGILKVVRTQNYKGGVRVSILCGKRALEYLDKQQIIVGQLTALLTTGADKVVDSVRRMADDNTTLRGQLSGVNSRLIDMEIAQTDPEQSDVLWIRDEGLDGNTMRSCANKLADKHRGYCGVFCGSDDSGYKYIIVSGSDNKDTTVLQNILREEFGAKGGGSKSMIQGSILKATISDVIERCKKV